MMQRAVDTTVRMKIAPGFSISELTGLITTMTYGLSLEVT